MNILPINEATIDIIEVLNDGVRPEFEIEETFFIWNGPDEAPEIINRDVLESERFQRYMAVVKMLYIKQ